MTLSFTESVVEDAALTWLESPGWHVLPGPQIAPGELAAERISFGQVVLEQRLRDALARLNHTLSADMLLPKLIFGEVRVNDADNIAELAE
ncbi:MAG: hypothetical protein NTU41_11055 [Chloroflexi bacterium]|nr:hypothetical protein [Chloroflexota bacterium]